MSLLSRLTGRRRADGDALYRAIVAAGRDPGWYRAGVPDTIDGRFDMIAALLALVLLRLEREGDSARAASVRLTETFIADMDGTIRQLGIGDLMVGKHVGRMMGALGGRLAAFRDAAGAGFDVAVRRNIFHDAPPSPAALATVSGRLARLAAALDAAPAAAVLAGGIELT